MRLITAALGLLLAAPSQTFAADLAAWQSGAAESSLEFAAYYEGERLPGVFSRFDVRLETDAAGNVPMSLRVEVAMGSADMNDDEVNAELLGPAFFDVAGFPTAVFNSDEIRAVDNAWLAVGKLNIKGNEQALELPLTWQQDAASALLQGSLTLSRSAWEVGTGEWSGTASLADRVEVQFHVVLAPAP